MYLTDRERNEQKHDKDTGGGIIFDVHCYYCVTETHTKQSKQFIYS